MVSIVTRGLLEAAHREIDGRLGHRKRGTPLMELPELSICGLSASLWASGFPSILLSRLCSFPSFRQNYSILNISARRLRIVTVDEASMSRAADDLRLPSGFRFVDAYRSSGNNIMGLRSSDGHETAEDKDIFTSVYCLLQPVISVSRIEARRDEQCPQCASALATFVVRMMLTDIAKSIEDAFGGRPNLTRNAEKT